MEVKQQDILSLKRSRGLLSLLLLQSLLFSISLKVWSEGQLVGMQFSLLKCSNYLNIHQAWKRRQSKFPLLKCYNMGRSENKYIKEKCSLQKEHYKKKFKYFQVWKNNFVLLSAVVHLQFKPSLFLTALWVIMKWKESHPISLPHLVCHRYDGKTSTVNGDIPVTTLTRLGSSFAGYKPNVYQKSLTVMCACKHYCNSNKSHSAQMEA